MHFLLGIWQYNGIILPDWTISKIINNLFSPPLIKERWDLTA
jgi:hypothetical protein